MYTHTLKTIFHQHVYTCIYMCVRVCVCVYIRLNIHNVDSLQSIYGVALVSRIDKTIGLFCKRAL